MPIKMYQPNGTVLTWEDEFSKMDHQYEKMLPHVRYYPENEVPAPEAPKHYAKGGIETIDHIRAKLSPEEFCGYCRGNVMKYIDRFTEKDGIADLKKLIVYAQWLVEAYEKRLVFPHKVVE